MATSKKVSKASTSSPRGRRPNRASRTASSSEKARANLKSSLPRLRLTGKYQRPILTLVALLLILGGARLWYLNSYADPQTVFEKMVDHNLTLTSVTRQVDQPVCVPTAQNAGNILQITYFPTLQARCITRIIDSSTTPSSMVTVESIGTKAADYEHYASIDKPGSPTAKYNDLYKLWLKNGIGSSSQQLLIKSLFNPILFGDIRQPERAKIAGQLKSSYSVDYNNVHEGQAQNGRKIYSYNVTINLNKFSKAWNSYINYYGFPAAYVIKAGTYNDGSKLTVVMQVDRLSRQVKSVSFQGVSEVYNAYGISNPAGLPTKFTTPANLQNVLNSIK